MPHSSLTLPLSFPCRWLIATEEICPPTHKILLHQKLHPSAPEVGVMKSFGTTKIWSDMDLQVKPDTEKWPVRCQLAFKRDIVVQTAKAKSDFLKL